MNLASLALLLTAVGLAASGQLMLKKGMLVAAEKATATHTSLVVRAATSPWVLVGLCIFGISAIAWLATLSRVPLSIAYPFNALGFLAILISSALLLNERTNVWTWVGTLLVIAGLIVVVMTKPPVEAKQTDGGALSSTTALESTRE